MIKGLKIEIDPKVDHISCGICGKMKPWKELVQLKDNGFFIKFRFFVEKPENLETGEPTKANGHPVCLECKNKED